MSVVLVVHLQRKLHVSCGLAEDCVKNFRLLSFTYAYHHKLTQYLFIYSVYEKTELFIPLWNFCEF